MADNRFDPHRGETAGGTMRQTRTRPAKNGSEQVLIDIHAKRVDERLFRSMGKTMKRHLMHSLAGLTICSVMPALALTGDLAGDSNALDKLSALSVKFEDAYEKRDAAAIGALFTEDAVCLTPEGLFCGRKAIEKACADDFRRWVTASQIHETDQLNAFVSGAWSIGQWWRTLQAQEGLKFVRGYWSALLVREGDGWKIRMITFNETSPRVEPAPTE